MNNWRKFWRLPAEERALVLEALALLPLVRLGLRIFGWRRVQRALAISRRKSCNHESDNQAAMVRARRSARLVAAAANLVGGSCLIRSIVLTHALERQGIGAELRIGVNKNERGLEAHAWVDVCGIPLNEGTDVAGRYAAFDQNFALARTNRQ